MVLDFGTTPAQTKASSSFHSPPASSTSHNRSPRQKLPQALVLLFALGWGFRLPVPEVSSFPQVWAKVCTRTGAVVAGQWPRWGLCSPTQLFLPGTDFSPSGTAGGFPPPLPGYPSPPWRGGRRWAALPRALKERRLAANTRWRHPASHRAWRRDPLGRDRPPAGPFRRQNRLLLPAARGRHGGARCLGPHAWLPVRGCPPPFPPRRHEEQVLSPQVGEHAPGERTAPRLVSSAAGVASFSSSVFGLMVATGSRRRRGGSRAGSPQRCEGVAAEPPAPRCAASAPHPGPQRRLQEPRHRPCTPTAASV